MRFRSIGLLLLCGVLAGACARQPSTSRAEATIQRFFSRYAKKYPTSDFGRSSITSAAVQSIEEVHKRYVAATSTVTFQDGHTESVRCALENRPPRGWRVVSWERLTTPITNDQIPITK